MAWGGLDRPRHLQPPATYISCGGEPPAAQLSNASALIFVAEGRGRLGATPPLTPPPHLRTPAPATKMPGHAALGPGQKTQLLQGPRIPWSQHPIKQHAHWGVFAHVPRPLCAHTVYSTRCNSVTPCLALANSRTGSSSSSSTRRRTHQATTPTRRAQAHGPHCSRPSKPSAPSADLRPAPPSSCLGIAHQRLSHVFPFRASCRFWLFADRLPICSGGRRTNGRYLSSCHIRPSCIDCKQEARRKIPTPPHARTGQNALLRPALRA